MRKVSMTLALLLTVASFVSFCWWWKDRVQKSIAFDKAFTSYCMNSVKARTTEEAWAEIVKAVKFLEDNNLTSGSTSILGYESDEDLGVFYQKMKQRQAILESAKNNQLDPLTAQYTFHVSMVGEDHLNNQSISEIKGLPSGISIYPHNTRYFLWVWGSIIGLLVGLTWAYFSLKTV